MVGDLASNCFAWVDFGFRVRPRMVNFSRSGEERRTSTTALPCLPVAPVTRMTFGGSDIGRSQIGWTKLNDSRNDALYRARNCRYQIYRRKKDERSCCMYVPKLKEMVGEETKLPLLWSYWATATSPHPVR